MKLRIYEIKILKHQDSISVYPYVSQEIWPNKNVIGEQNFDLTQVFLDIVGYDRFAMKYYVFLFFNLNTVIMRREETCDKITKMLNKIKISLSNKISHPIVLMYVNAKKNNDRLMQNFI